MSGQQTFPVARLSAEALWNLSSVAAELARDGDADMREFVDAAIEQRRRIIQRHRRERRS